MPTIAVNPIRCRVWNLHARLDEHVTEDSCKEEIASFERHGQLVPVLGRTLRGEPDYDIEVIYGARRLFVARHLNVPLLVDLRNVSDRDGLIAMDIENRQRADLSAYERGSSYDRWLREGHFKSQEELANVLQVSAAQVSRLLKLARLPPAVIAAFAKPTEICEVWGAELSSLLKDPVSERRIMAAASRLASEVPRLPAADVYRDLCAAATLRRRAGPEERVITGRSGEELFRVRHQRGSIVFSVPMNVLSQRSLKEIEQVIACEMDRQAMQEFAARMQRYAESVDEESALA